MVPFRPSLSIAHPPTGLPKTAPAATKDYKAIEIYRSELFIQCHHLQGGLILTHLFLSTITVFAQVAQK